MIEKTIQEAIVYARTHLGLAKDDEIYYTNLLLQHYSLALPYAGSVDEKAIAAYPLPDPIVNAIVAYWVDEKGMDEGYGERDAAYVMGLLSPLPSRVNETFHSRYEENPEKATEYLYDLSIKNDYIAKSRVDKNLHWDAVFDDGPALEISVNLSKPEKNNKDIAKLVTAKKTGYPACLLCEENVGFAGSESHPARENIRFVPLTLNHSRWLLQYSPYVYYSHHCIVFYEKHTPMTICPETFRCLFDFVDLFPHFFLGSNSDLPIVGGSILNHWHFQGGGHLLPLLTAKDKEIVYVSKKASRVSVLDFYVTAVKVSGKDREDVLSLADKILWKWRHYEDPDHDIIADDAKGNHSTLTPFARKVAGEYQLTLVLRNNRCDATYPDGIFHAHPEHFAIKSEGIGLIEAAGLFILPARLVRQGKEVEDVLANHLSEKESLEKYPDLTLFKGMIEELGKTGESVESYINKTCQDILRNVAVYKEDEKGQEGLHAFLKEALA